MKLGFLAIAFVLAAVVTTIAGVTAEEATTPGDACSAPTANSLRTAIANAAGKPRASEREIFDFTANGLSGRRVRLRAGSDSRETTLIGPLRTERGTYRGQSWHRDENGQTIVEAGDPGRATGDPTATTISCTTVPPAGYVVSVLDGAGYGSRSYVDARTFHVYRVDIVSAASVTSTTYDDFRTTDGSTIAWHRRRSDGVAVDDGDERIVALDPAPIADIDLAIPASRKLVTFPAGTTSVALPVRFENGKMLVRTTIGSRGLDLTLDTGDSAGIALDADVVRSLGLPIYGEHSTAENAGRTVTGRAIVPELHVGALVLHDVVVTTLPHLDFQSPGQFKSVGLLGYDFFAGTALRISYARASVTATDPAAFARPLEPNAIAVPVRLGLGVPLADFTVDGSLGERFAIDTGASGSLLIFDYFARRHPEALANPAAKIGKAKLQGIGGRFDVDTYRLTNVRFADAAFEGLTAYRVLGKAYGSNIDGLIGSDFLRSFTVYSDYARSTFYFVREPSST